MPEPAIKSNSNNAIASMLQLSKSLSHHSHHDSAACLFPEMAFPTKSSHHIKPSLDVIEAACRTILDEHRRLIGMQENLFNEKEKQDILSRLGGQRDDITNGIPLEKLAVASFPEDLLPSNSSPGEFGQRSSREIGKILSKGSSKSSQKPLPIVSLDREDKTLNAGGKSEPFSRFGNSKTGTTFFEDLADGATAIRKGTLNDTQDTHEDDRLPAICSPERDGEGLNFSKLASERVHFKIQASEAPSIIPKSAKKMVHDFALASGWHTDAAANSGHLASHGIVFCARIALSNNFDSLCAMAIISNAIVMAIAANYAAYNSIGRDRDMPLFYILSDYVFTVWFISELIIRILAEGPFMFWSIFQPNAPWNYFDFVVVTMNVFETSLAMMSEEEGGANLTALRVVRILRVARALRILRLVRLFRALRKMVLAILGSFTTLLWAIVLLMIIIFVFGLFLTEQVTKHLHRDTEDLDGLHDAGALSSSFGSLWLAAYTLFLSVSGGVSWQEVSDPLFRIHHYIGLTFCLYIFFTIFAMLNIITGIFVDTAMSAAQSDKDECIVEQLHSQDSAVRQMQKIFIEVDHDKSGMINEEEFNQILDNPAMMAHLASLGIDAGGAEGLFRLLDMDDSGTITPEEFLVGCMRMKGSAKSVDVVSLMYENKRMVERWNRFMQYVEKQSKVRREFETRMAQCMKDIMKSFEKLRHLEGLKHI